MIFAYFGLGAICIAYSVWLLATRRKHRGENSASNDREESQDSDNIAAN
jgi:hypothetical protein